MSASMAEVIAAHCETDELRCHAPGCDHTYQPYFAHYEGPGDVDDRVAAVSAHIASVLAANGYGKLEQAWDEGYTTGNAHNGRRDANPYRAVTERESP